LVKDKEVERQGQLTISDVTKNCPEPRIAKVEAPIFGCMKKYQRCRQEIQKAKDGIRGLRVTDKCDANSRDAEICERGECRSSHCDLKPSNPKVAPLGAHS
jgi:hypothetical protein